MTSIGEILSSVKSGLDQFPTIKIKDIIEMLIIAFVIYHIIVWFKGTRAWMLIKGIMVLGIISAIALIFELNTILWIFSKTLNVGIIALIIVFQPEFRKALEQLGRRNIISTIFASEENKQTSGISDRMISEIVSAVYEMAKVKTGALIVMEQSEQLSDYEKTGIPIEAVVSKQLLINVFEHNTPLHDGAVIIRHDRIVAATCYLPLSDNMSLSKELGTRHRAGLGISEVSDAIVIIVSEETGKVSVALNGNLVRGVESEYLKNKLLHLYLETNEEQRRFKLWKGWPKVNGKDNE